MILLDGRPVLPPAQLTIVVSVKILETIVGGFVGNSIRVVPREHHVILLHPVLIGHDSIVNNGLSNVALALRVVPEAADEFVMRVVLSLLPLFDDAVVIDVSESELVAHVGLIRRMVVKDVVKR